MSIRLTFYGYKKNSKGMKRLAKELQDTGAFHGHPYRRTINEGAQPYLNEERSYDSLVKDVVVNWGESSHTCRFAVKNGSGYLFLNPNGPNQVANKLRFFRTFSEDNSVAKYLPRFWTNKEEVLDETVWGDGSRPVIVERHKLKGHSGQGIILRSTPEELTIAPLYVEYIRKAAEYRAHFFKDGGIKYQKKLYKAVHPLPPNHPSVHQIRTHHNGWVYSKIQEATDLGVPHPVILAANAFQNSNYSESDFGALDIIYNKGKNKAYILECNSAPGIEESTVKFYRDEILNKIGTHDFSAGVCHWTPSQ